MNKKNLDQALAALADALASQENPNTVVGPMEFIKKLPWRSLSGDHINGGKITNFSSAGITDRASTEQLVITNDGVAIAAIKDNLIVNGDIAAKTVKADVLEVKEIKADIKLEKDAPITFGGANVYGKGLLWTSKDYTKQFVFQSNPDRFFSTEFLDVQKGKGFSVNGIKVLDEAELGTTVVKSNLREVGRLKGLIVDGSMSINQYMYYNSSSDRLGLGTEEPNAALSICDQGIEIVLGSSEYSNAAIGVFNSADLEIVTDNTPRITIKAGGDIDLGNKNTSPIKVSVNGTLSINVRTPDPRTDLHVSGAIKFNNTLHLKGSEPPSSGSFNQGDIVWNSNPQQRHFVGWICTQGGTPGIWNQFGEIK